VPGVAAATTSGWATPDGLYVNGEPVDTQIFGDVGPIRPAISHGRAPVVQGEIALGPKTLAEVGVSVGDEVALSLTPTGRSVRGRVVGEVVLASPFFFDFAPGTGAATVAATFDALGDDSSSGIIIVRYADGADDRRTFAAVAAALGTFDAFETADRQNVSGLGRMRLVPILLLVGLLVLVAAAVAHVLLTSGARRRRDVAVLRALGFTRQQSWASVTIHASLVVVAACLVGIPLGVVLGRTIWDSIAANFYVVPRPIVPMDLLMLLVAALVVVAVMASLVPGARVIGPRPAAVLRAD
jgi:predicted lysophospholipase L1 biosynthesis ABC-type transport system permease subunit